MRLTTTGIGSLPFSDMKEALDHVFEHYTLPFLPQIARGDGDGGMLALVLPPDLGKRLQSGFGVALTDLLEDPAIQAAFRDIDSIPRTRALQDAREAATLLMARRPLPRFKAQLMGPLSLLQTLRDAASRPLWSDPSMHDTVLAWSTALAEAMAAVLQPCCEKLALWADEPMLGLMEDPAQRSAAFTLLERWRASVAALGVETGIHCCSRPPLDLLPEAPFSVFSCDAVRYPQDLTDNVDVLASFIGQGGTLALGLLSPMNWGEDQDQCDFVAGLAEALGLSTREELSHGLILTPSCGTMLTPVDRELEIVNTLNSWSSRITEEWK